MFKTMRLTKNSRRLVIVGWSLVAVVFLAYFLTVLRLDFAQMLVPCQGANCNFLALSNIEIKVLTSWGTSTHAYAYYMSAVTVLLTLPYWVLGGLIVWQQGSTRVGLAVSLALIIIPISTYGGSTDWAVNYPKLVIPGIFLNVLGTVIMLVFFYLIPNGWFSPGWAYIPLIITIFLIVILTLQINGIIAFSDKILSLLGPTIIGFIILGGSFHIYRYRLESTPMERQQTKWMLFGVITYILGVVLWVFIFGRALYIPAGKSRLLAMMIGWFSVNITLLGLPVAITIAISRYRLWDIDRIIRKTLQYSLLTLLLALVYFGSVLLLQTLVENLTGQQSQIAIVFSTLAIAALFNPLRTRVQDFIDRRFFRKKNNTEQTLARFAVVARDEVDMDKLTTALLGVVEESMQPERVSVWLRAPEMRS